MNHSGHEHCPGEHPPEPHDHEHHLEHVHQCSAECHHTQAVNEIDTMEAHIHHEGCGHVHHDEVAEHIDYTSHHEHGPGCGHVHHEQAAIHVDDGKSERPRTEHYHSHFDRQSDELSARQHPENQEEQQRRIEESVKPTELTPTTPPIKIEEAQSIPTAEDTVQQPPTRTAEGIVASASTRDLSQEQAIPKEAVYVEQRTDAQTQTLQPEAPSIPAERAPTMTEAAPKTELSVAVKPTAEPASQEAAPQATESIYMNDLVRIEEQSADIEETTETQARTKAVPILSPMQTEQFKIELATDKTQLDVEVGLEPRSITIIESIEEILAMPDDLPEQEQKTQIERLSEQLEQLPPVELAAIEPALKRLTHERPQLYRERLFELTSAGRFMNQQSTWPSAPVLINTSAIKFGRLILRFIRTDSYSWLSASGATIRT